jgi:hemolysin activation/secretion protein
MKPATRTRSAIRCLLTASALSSGAALAQPVPAARSREEIDRPGLRTPGAAPSRVRIDGGIERAPCPLDEPRFQGITVAVSDVQFAGLKGLPGDALRPSYEAFLGTTQPISVVCTIRDAASAILRDQGYLAAVQVPPQRIENGTIRFDVIMGRLVAVHVRGDAGAAERTIAAYLQRIQAQEVFNTQAAERYLLMVRDLPGYDLRMVLRAAGTGPGELIGEVIVERQPIEIDASVQNFGSKSVGRWGGLLRASFNGLTGLADRTTIGVYSTADFREQQVYQLSHDFRLGPDGISIGGRLAYAITRPSLIDTATALPGDPDIRAETLLGTFEAGYGLRRSQSGNVRLAGGLDIVDQEIRFGPAVLSRDKLRIAFARLDFDAVDAAGFQRSARSFTAEPRWRLGGSLELRKGTAMFGASKGCGASGLGCPLGSVLPSDPGADPQAFVVRFRGVAELRPSRLFAIALMPRAQYSAQSLLAFEKFSLGNYTVGRGYDPGVVTGDRGIGLGAEVRIGSLVPSSPGALSIQPFAFIDAARVWNERQPDFQPRNASLVSVGGGVRGALGNRARLDLTAAVPLKRAGLAERKGDVRVLMSVTLGLWPWRAN